MRHKQLPFQSEEEWYLFLEYIRTSHKIITDAYNFSTKNIIGKLIITKEKLDDYERLLNLTDKLIVTFRNEETITLKTVGDLYYLKILINTKNWIVKTILWNYQFTNKEKYKKLVTLLDKMHSTLAASLEN